MANGFLDKKRSAARCFASFFIQDEARHDGLKLGEWNGLGLGLVTVTGSLRLLEVLSPGSRWSLKGLEGMGKCV